MAERIFFVWLPNRVLPLKRRALQKPFSISCLLLVNLAVMLGLSSQPIIISSTFIPMQNAYAEEIISIVPGSTEPGSDRFFDPPFYVLDKDQPLVFFNHDVIRHRIIVKSADDLPVFDTGIMESKDSASYTFTEYGDYKYQCEIHPQMKGEILVTDDIATFTQTSAKNNLDVQLSWSPTDPKMGETAYFKVIFIDKSTGKNHPHIDYHLIFENSTGAQVYGYGGHSTDGTEYLSCRFDQQGNIIPKVKILGINLLPIEPETLMYNMVVTPEFPVPAVGAVAAVVIGTTAILARTKLLRHHARPSE